MIKRSDGFTVIELMIATVILSVLMLIASAAIIGLSRQYYKGINQARAQEVTRNIIDEITAGIQYSEDAPVALPSVTSPQAWCVSDLRYVIKIGQKLARDSSLPGPNESSHVLSRDGNCDLPASDCPVGGAAQPPCDDATELIADNMRLIRLDISGQLNAAGDQIAQNAQVFNVKVTVGIGEDDLFCSTVFGNCSNNTVMTPAELIAYKDTLQCKNTRSSQYCATATSEITIVKRL